MSQEDVKNLFQPYFRTTDQTSLRMNKQSHGLGLSICKMIAEKLDGDIEVQSEREEGSTFIFSFRTSVKVKACRGGIKKHKAKKLESAMNLSVI